MPSLANDFENAFILLVTFNAKLYAIIGLSLFVSCTATLLATWMALPFGIWLAIQKFPLRNLCLSILNGLTGLPPVALGLAMYILLSRAGPMGRFGILYTPLAMVVTQCILVFPIIAAQVRNISEEHYKLITPYYKMLKLTKWQITFSILFEIRFFVFTAIMAGLGRALSEVGAMLIVGGNIQGYTRIMTTAISLETSKGALEFALALGIILLLIIFAINICTTYINAYTKKYYGY